MNNKIKLKSYAWQAINVKGERIAGVGNASSYQELCKQLQLQDIFLIHARRHFNFHLLGARNKTISRKQISGFITQLATLIEASIPLTVAFTIISTDNHHVGLTNLINAIKLCIEQGSSLSSALAKFPEYFSGVDCSLIEAGEASGMLSSFLMQLAHYQQHLLNLRNRIVKAMYYPTCIVIVAVLMTTAMLTFIVPQFENIFSSFGSQLPVITLLIIEFSRSLRQHGLIWLGILIVGIYLLTDARRRSVKIRIITDVLLLKMPFVKQLIVEANLARFSRIFALMIEVGIPLLDALRAATKALSNYQHRRTMQQVIDKVTGGMPLNQALRMNPLFSAQVCQMINVGESSGRLVVMLTKIADIHQNRLDQLLDHLYKCLEPVLMMVIAVLVGGLIIALYLPIFKMGGVI